MALSWDDLGPYSRLVNTSIVDPRAYQINIMKSVASGRNTIVILPTGLGKTIIAIFAIANALQKGKKAVILAPTKPLSEQHYKSLAKLLNIEEDKILLLTGSINRLKREELERNAKVIAATPQTFANDLKSGRISLDEFGIVIFDECHKAVGMYAYTYIANESKVMGVQTLGLTASPGSNSKKINSLIESLGTENIEIRISTDADVEPYVKQKDISVVSVEKGDTINAILAKLKPVIDEHLGNLYSHGLSPFKDYDKTPKGRLLEIGNNIRRIEAQNYKFMGLFNYVYVLNVGHAYDLASTEGLHPFASYMDGLEKREPKGRAIKSILSNKSIISAVDIAKKALEKGEEHPKMAVIVDMIKDKMMDKSIMVFAQYRSTTHQLAKMLNENGIPAREFVGKKNGVTQAQQQLTLKDFAEGKFRVLVATSIGEEGLDIPSVDSVIFYEPIPNEIRNIQRKGRAGRMKIGSVVIVVARGTKDETYLFIARIRERRMRDLVLRMKERLDRGLGHYSANKGQRQL
jgi:Fanconi anemia group M protein